MAKKNPAAEHEKEIREKETREKEKHEGNSETASAEEEAAPATEENTLEAELAAEKDRYMRLAAEYDNYRKRSARERESIYADVRADTIIKLLPVYDNLERALKQETGDEAYRKGVELTMTQLREILRSMSVTEIPAEGEKFDPVLHNAVMHVEDESLGESVITEEFQKGFRLGDKVIRFSLVKVAN